VLNKAQHRFFGYVDNKAKVKSQLQQVSGEKLNALDVGSTQKTQETFVGIDQSKSKPRVESEQKQNIFERTLGKLFGTKTKSISGPEL